MASTHAATHHHVPHPHDEPHRSDRAGWLRAAVLGANDGVVSTACLIVGVAGAGASFGAVRTAGIAGLAAGALSMAVGEYVSVASQRDIEQADLRIERQALEDHPVAELRELAQIWEHRGLEPGLAMQVAEQLTADDALGAHARDELGLTADTAARPAQAAAVSRWPSRSGRWCRCSPSSPPPTRAGPPWWWLPPSSPSWAWAPSARRWVRPGGFEPWPGWASAARPPWASPCSSVS